MYIKGEKEPARIYIHFICATVGHTCNLRCRDCANLTPFAPADLRHYDVDRIIEQLDIITKYADIRLLQIQGGEPFLYQELERLLDHVRACGEIQMCQIATNGTVLPKVSPEALQGEKFMVRISHYPVEEDVSAEVQKWLAEHSIRSRIYHFISREDKWFDLGKTYNPYGDVEERFQNCLFKNCFTLENGVIERCARAVNSQRLLGFEAENVGGGQNGDGDYLPVRDRAGFREALERYIMKPHAMEACRYCGGTEGKAKLDPAVQLPPGTKWED